MSHLQRLIDMVLIRQRTQYQLPSNPRTPEDVAHAPAAWIYYIDHQDNSGTNQRLNPPGQPNRCVRPEEWRFQGYVKGRKRIAFQVHNNEWRYARGTDYQEWIHNYYNLYGQWPEGVMSK